MVVVTREETCAVSFLFSLLLAWFIRAESFRTFESLPVNHIFTLIRCLCSFGRISKFFANLVVLENSLWFDQKFPSWDLYPSPTPSYLHKNRNTIAAFLVTPNTKAKAHWLSAQTKLFTLLMYGPAGDWVNVQVFWVCNTFDQWLHSKDAIMPERSRDKTSESNDRKRISSAVVVSKSFQKAQDKR